MITISRVPSAGIIDGSMLWANFVSSSITCQPSDSSPEPREALMRFISCSFCSIWSARLWSSCVVLIRPGTNPSGFCLLTSGGWSAAPLPTTARGLISSATDASIEIHGQTWLVIKKIHKCGVRTPKRHCDPTCWNHKGIMSTLLSMVAVFTGSSLNDSCTCNGSVQSCGVRRVCA